MASWHEYRTVLFVDTMATRATRVVGGAFVLFATSALGTALGAFPNMFSPFEGPTSPLQETFLIGLACFPCGTYCLLGALLRFARTRASDAWPLTKAQVFENEDGPSYGRIRSIIPFSYAIGGQRFENRLAVFGGSKSVQYVIGSEIDVRVDPQDARVVVLAARDDNVRLKRDLGLAIIALPFVLGPLASLAS
jgi:hypothetical protein